MKFLLALLISTQGFTYEWGEAEKIPHEGIKNPLQLSEKELNKYNRAGRYHALNYPVTVTGALIPYRPVKRVLNGETDGLFIDLIEMALQKVSRFSSFDSFLAWIGLHKYPSNEGEGAYFIPFSPRKDMHVNWLPDRMGLSILETQSGTKAFTFSCAACHSSQLFGRTVLGLQNRFPRANRVYVLGDRVLGAVPTPLFRKLTRSTKEEAMIYRRTRKNMKYVESRNPRTLGLDTSLAHTALSLSHRKRDSVASKSSLRGLIPRRERLRRQPADSKPGTWWNVKYKNKWLLDGSVVSGNPIFTNILWNEIGRGTDLIELERWLDENSKVIDELTAAVYNAEAPHITDFFPESRFSMNDVKAGQKVYRKLSCKKCHGDYVKNWELGLSDPLKTYKVKYFQDTPVKDVGTDPYRYKAMKSLVQLNDLEISKKNNARIKVQKGYVPPPLVGIWARWPYFHNISVPSLCALLTPESERPKTYMAIEPRDKEKDFDFNCNGYPENLSHGSKYDTRKKAMSNKGHSEKILVKNGKTLINEQEKKQLIRFLQTL